MFAAAWSGSLAVADVPLFQVWPARTRAERIADQAAVLVAEGRPVPASLTRGADVDVRGHDVRVRRAGDARRPRRTDVTAAARTP